MALMLMACGTVWKRRILKKYEVFDEKEKENLCCGEGRTEKVGGGSEQGRWEAGVGLFVCSVSENS